MGQWPWPKMPSAEGVGTSEQDLQRIVGAQYHTSGILPTGGCEVTGTSGMAYEVSPGAIVLHYGEGLALMHAVEGQTILTEPAPATGSRVDRIAMDRDGFVRVVQGPAPAGGITLRTFTVPAGITATEDAQPSDFDRNFAIPAGASLGRLHAYHDPSNNVVGKKGEVEKGFGEFELPSDRLVRFDLTHCVSALQNDVEGVDSAAVRWRVYIDDLLELSFHTRVTWKSPQVNFMSFTTLLREGSHRVNYRQDQTEGVNSGFIMHKGGPGAYPGMRFEVWDAGVAR